MSTFRKLIPYWYIAFPTVGGSLYMSTLYFKNRQRVENSLTNSVMMTIKNDTEMGNVLGNDIKIAGLVVPWVDGVVNPVKGIYDVEFKAQGDKGKLSMKIVMTRVPNSDIWRLRYWTCTNDEVKYKGTVVDEMTGKVEFSTV